MSESEGEGGLLGGGGGGGGKGGNSSSKAGKVAGVGCATVCTSGSSWVCSGSASSCTSCCSCSSVSDWSASIYSTSDDSASAPVPGSVSDSSDESKFAEKVGCVWGCSWFDGPATGAGSSNSSGSASCSVPGM